MAPNDQNKNGPEDSGDGNLADQHQGGTQDLAYNWDEEFKFDPDLPLTHSFLTSSTLVPVDWLISGGNVVGSYRDLAGLYVCVRIPGVTISDPGLWSDINITMLTTSSTYTDLCQAIQAGPPLHDRSLWDRRYFRVHSVQPETIMACWAPSGRTVFRAGDDAQCQAILSAIVERGMRDRIDVVWRTTTVQNQAS